MIDKEEIQELKVGDQMYYARYIPDCGVGEILEVIINTIYDNSLIAYEKAGRAYVISKTSIGNACDKNRLTVVEWINDQEERCPLCKDMETCSIED